MYILVVLSTPYMQLLNRTKYSRLCTDLSNVFTKDLSLRFLYPSSVDIHAGIRHKPEAIPSNVFSKTTISSAEV
jgi:hypothetical protein